MQKNQSKYRRVCWQYLKICLILLTTVLHNQGFCQEIKNFRLFGGPSQEQLTVMSSTDDCQIVIGGVFGEGMNFGGESLNNNGRGDIFCGSINEGVETLFTHGGSTEVDDLTAIVHDSQSNLFIAGSFIEEATFQDSILLSGDPDIFTSFISKYVKDELLWSMIINGSTFEEVTDMVVDEFDNLYVAGYFGKDLVINNNFIISTDANIASFIFKMNKDGEILWIKSYGLEGDNRAQELSYCKVSKQLFISGNFKGVFTLGETMIQTNTSDADLFIGSVDLDGNALWLIKAGGVYEDTILDMISSETGDIFLTGNFRGIIDIDEQLEIRTQGSLDDNFFVIKLDKNGSPLWARSLGEQEYSESGLAMCLSDENELFLTGYTNGFLDIDGIKFEPDDKATYHFFVSSFNAENGSLKWIIGPEDATGLIVPSVMELTDCGDLIVGGGIRGSILVQNDLHTSEEYDGFLAEIDLELTSLSTTEKLSSNELYPNPNNGCFYMDLDEDAHFYLYNISGQLVLEQEHFAGEEICVTGFTGLYYWSSLTNKGIRKNGKLVIEK